jgi:hypothetical protein
MERIMTRKAFDLVAIAAVLLAAPAVAHHSFAMFDQTKTLYLTGTVKQFDFEDALPDRHGQAVRLREPARLAQCGRGQ